MMSLTNVAYHNLNDFAVIHSLQNFYQFFYFSCRKYMLLLIEKL